MLIQVACYSLQKQKLHKMSKDKAKGAKAKANRLLSSRVI
jgi:hypothetical protein